MLGQQWRAFRRTDGKYRSPNIDINVCDRFNKNDRTTVWTFETALKLLKILVMLNQVNLGWPQMIYRACFNAENEINRLFWRPIYWMNVVCTHKSQKYEQYMVTDNRISLSKRVSMSIYETLSLKFFFLQSLNIRLLWLQFTEQIDNFINPKQKNTWRKFSTKSVQYTFETEFWNIKLKISLSLSFIRWLRAQFLTLICTILKHVSQCKSIRLQNYVLNVAMRKKN